jgi:hypothetical protein
VDKIMWVTVFVCYVLYKVPLFVFVQAVEAVHSFV